MGQYCKVWKLTFNNKEEYDSFVKNTEIQESFRYIEKLSDTDGKVEAMVHHKERVYKTQMGKLLGDYELQMEPG